MKAERNKVTIYIMAQAYWEKNNTMETFTQRLMIEKTKVKLLYQDTSVSTLKHIVSEKTEVLWKYAIYKISPHINNIHTRHFIQ